MADNIVRYSAFMASIAKLRKFKLIAVTATIAVVIFALDLALPLGVAEGILYVTLVSTGVLFPRRIHIYGLAMTGTVLTAVGFFLSPPGGVMWMVLTNRGLSIAAIWMTAILLAIRLNERRSAEEEIKTERDRLVDAVESFTGGFIYYDADDRMVICNENYLKAMDDVADILKPGLTFEAFLRVRAERGQRRDGLTRDAAWIAERLYQHRNPSGPIERSFADGTTFQLHEFKTREGGTVIIRTDVTALNKSEQRLMAAKIEAETANRSKSEFLANMSHELRTPLNAILGFSDALKTGVFGKLADPRQLGYVENIHESGSHLLDLITDILDVSLIDAGRLELQEAPTSVAELADASIRLVQQRAAHEKVRLVNTLSGDRRQIFMDARRVKQILVNLLSNAIKFTPENGEVTLAADIRNDGCFVLSVADTGVGMDAAGLATAIEKFGQNENQLSPLREGAGLGLPLSKSLIEAHGGDIEIESQPGQGTIVRICFPEERLIDAEKPA
jgi:two-component system cell cycle sensor histidine kinase PleC